MIEAEGFKRLILFDAMGRDAHGSASTDSKLDISVPNRVTYRWTIKARSILQPIIKLWRFHCFVLAPSGLVANFRHFYWTE